MHAISNERPSGGPVLKKILILGVAAAGFATATLIPLSASADRVTRCSPGSSNPNYCVHPKKCVVPELQGVSVNDALRLLFKHDCRLGDVHIVRWPGHRGTPTLTP